MHRFLAHRAVIDGVVFDGLTFVHVRPDWSVVTQPYKCETHSTVFVNGTLYIDTKKHDISQRPQR